MQPKLYFSSEHGIHRDDIDPDALYVLTHLHDAGYIAYVVGGGVRDLLRSKAPKDFDISTSARPDEIKRLFRGQCLLIGRRFRLAHIRFGKKILEVSTFRSGDTSEKDLIVRDNLWGTPEEDVLRRDFTINGLFYDPVEETVIDYVHGCEDLHKHLLRTIGDPQTRFIQDPVRMIRLLKFRARFGYDIEPATLEALHACRSHLLHSAPARVIEEMFRMLESGSAVPFLRLMLETGLLEIIWPAVNRLLVSPFGEKIYDLLSIADSYHAKDKRHSLPRSVLAACLYFGKVEAEIAKQQTHVGEEVPLAQILSTISQVLDACEQSPFARPSRRLRTELEYVLAAQYRFQTLDPKRPRALRTTHHPEFLQALEFLRLRASLEPHLHELYAAWNRLSHKTPSSAKSHHHE